MMLLEGACMAGTASSSSCVGGVEGASNMGESCKEENGTSTVWGRFMVGKHPPVFSRLQLTDWV